MIRSDLLSRLGPAYLREGSFMEPQYRHMSRILFALPRILEHLLANSQQALPRLRKQHLMANRHLHMHSETLPRSLAQPPKGNGRPQGSPSPAPSLPNRSLDFSSANFSATKKLSVRAKLWINAQRVGLKILATLSLSPACASCGHSFLTRSISRTPKVATQAMISNELQGIQAAELAQRLVLVTGCGKSFVKRLHRLSL